MDDAINQYRNFHYGVGDYEENPIVIESDPEEGKACKVKTEEGSGSRGSEDLSI
jgi:hypothetical protein